MATLHLDNVNFVGSAADTKIAAHNGDAAAHGLNIRARSQVVLIGDSHTAANEVLDSTSPAYCGWNSRSPWFWVNARLGGGVPIEPSNVLGLGGQNSTQILAALPAFLAANTTAHVAVMCVGAIVSFAAGIAAAFYAPKL